MRVDPRHVLIAANPKSGPGSSRQKVSDLQHSLRSRGFDCQILTSLEQLHTDAVRLHADQQLRAVVSAGGDGTVAALANLLPADIPLLVFPLGTENLLAKYLGLSCSIVESTNVIADGRTLALDVGSANGKLFLVMLSCGFDAEVVRKMHATRSGHIKRWSYARPIVAALTKYRFPQLQPQLDVTENVGTNRSSAIAAKIDETAAWLFAFNVPRYAAGLNFCPQANPTDGLLDICTFQQSGILYGMGYLARLWTGSHQRMRGFRHRLCKTLRIDAPLDGNANPFDIPFQIDGDPGGMLPLDIELLPSRLTLLIPNSTET
jgi:diacylglycerol kinase (ATP)